MFQSFEDFLLNINSLVTHLQREKEIQIYFRKGLKKYFGDSQFEIEFREFADIYSENTFVRSKVYSFQNAIISLYGYLERYIEDCIIEYLKNVSIICPEYTRLPASVRKNHLNLSLELINKLQKIRGLPERELKIKLGSVVNNMNTFLNEESGFKINKEAFINHLSNFRFDTINEVFSRVGIDKISRNCLKDDEFIISINQKHNIDGISDHKILISLLMTELDDLAQRRNEIAHGVRLDDIESIDMTISRINFIKAYVKAINRVVESYLEKYRFSISPKLFLGAADKIFPSLKVVGFTEGSLLKDLDSNHKITEGDMLFAVNDNAPEKIISGRIISLRRDGSPQKVIDLPCDKPVTIGVCFDISINFKKRSFYVVPQA